MENKKTEKENKEVVEVEKEKEVENTIVKKENRLEKIGQIEAVEEQIQKIFELYQRVMKKDVDYGIIPGTSKPTLYKSGAEKISFMFRLVPEIFVSEKWLENGHLFVSAKCELWTQGKNAKLGEGVGTCSTLETKYRYRKIKNQVVGKIENTDIADTYNTVWKMAKKRAYIDAVLTVSGVSDIFTQDLEDIIDVENKQKETENKELQTVKKLLNEWYNLEAQAGISGSKYEFLEFVFGKVGSCDLSRKKSLKELSEQELKELIKIAKIEIKELKEVKK